MKNKKQLKMINWVIFILVISVGVVTAILTLYELNTRPHTTFGEEAQSRIEFRWGLLHTIISIAILVISTSLAIGWKRLFPFNVPIAIIMAGFCYVLFFLTFTVGWVGIQGMIGFFIAFLIGMILIISYSVSNLIERSKTIKG
jgi:hypothetical protein